MTATEGIEKNSKTCASGCDRGALRVVQGVQGDDADVAQLP